VAVSADISAETATNGAAKLPPVAPLVAPMALGVALGVAPSGLAPSVAEAQGGWHQAYYGWRQADRRQALHRVEV